MILELKNITKTYFHKDGPVNAMKDISFSVEEGSFITITGPSGSGKTTLLLTIGGLLRPSSGEIFFKDKKLKLESESEMSSFRDHHIGYVMQNFALIPYLNATQNVLIGLTGDSAKTHNKQMIAEAVLDLMGLSDRMNHYPRELSAGQQQRVAIARALVKKPSFILADEPTGNLDPALTGEILELLKEINDKQKITIIMVTHSPVAAAMGNTKIHLKNGCIEIH